MTTWERKLITEFFELTGENPIQLVRQLVFARLPHVVAALREIRATGIDPATVPNFDLALERLPDESVRGFYSRDATSWPPS